MCSVAVKEKETNKFWTVHSHRYSWSRILLSLELAETKRKHKEEDRKGKNNNKKVLSAVTFWRRLGDYLHSCLHVGNNIVINIYFLWLKGNNWIVNLWQMRMHLINCHCWHNFNLPCRCRRRCKEMERNYANYVRNCIVSWIKWTKFRIQ